MPAPIASAPCSGSSFAVFANEARGAGWRSRGRVSGWTGTGIRHRHRHRHWGGSGHRADRNRDPAPALGPALGRERTRGGPEPGSGTGTGTGAGADAGRTGTGIRHQHQHRHRDGSGRGADRSRDPAPAPAPAPGRERTGDGSSRPRAGPPCACHTGGPARCLSVPVAACGRRRRGRDQAQPRGCKARRGRRPELCATRRRQLRSSVREGRGKRIAVTRIEQEPRGPAEERGDTHHEERLAPDRRRGLVTRAAVQPSVQDNGFGLNSVRQPRWGPSQELQVFVDLRPPRPTGSGSYRGVGRRHAPTLSLTSHAGHSMLGTY